MSPRLSVARSNGSALPLAHMFIWAMFGPTLRRLAKFLLIKLIKMDSKIGFEMSLFVVGAIRGRCASFMILTATVLEMFGGQTNSSILVL